MNFFVFVVFLLIKKLFFKMFHITKTLFGNKLDVCERRTILVSFFSILPVAANFRINQVHTKRKKEQNTGIKSGNPCQNGYRNFFLNGACYSPVDELNFGCNSSLWCGGEPCEKYM